ncbi:hypothetical protein BCR42DRAFT_395515 [Absidia repens]|uniref:Uncharacterized protein n=1 Tax=Absidia repens TaxID=90262 RepID=A0A1X2I7C5_9FUNG|nr:hypothetical protein BCR42DRAFT_395515 [Absidia repens]
MIMATILNGINIDNHENYNAPTNKPDYLLELPCLHVEIASNQHSGKGAALSETGIRRSVTPAPRTEQWKLIKGKPNDKEETEDKIGSRMKKKHKVPILLVREGDVVVYRTQSRLYPASPPLSIALCACVYVYVCLGWMPWSNLLLTS